MEHLIDCLRRNYSEFPGVTAFVDYDSGKELSWKAVYESAGVLAGHLRKQFPESRYALVVSTHHPDFFLGIFACWFAGIIPVPVNENSKKSEFSLFKSVLNEAEPLIIIAGDIDQKTSSFNRTISKNVFSVSGHHSDAEPCYSPSDFALGLFTSGTTSLPKLMIFTHKDLYEAARVENENEKFCPGYRIANLRPQFTSGGLNTLWPQIYSGSTLILSEKMRKLAIERFLAEFLDKTAPDLLVVSPSWIVALSETLSTGLRVKPMPLYFGGMSAQEKTISLLTEAGFIPYMRYGMTEIGHIISKRKMVKNDSLQRNNMGIPYPNVPVKIRNGKIGFRTKGAASFEMKSGKFVPAEFHEGYFYSDDAGEISEDGSLLLIGRDALIVNVNGFRFNVLQVEHFLKDSGIVKDCRLLKTSANSHGDVLTCFCILIPGSDTKQIHEFCRKELPSFKWPSEIIALEDWPYLANGKIDLSRLKAFSERENH